MKKLITVTWSESIEVTIPDDATLDSLNHWSGAHREQGENIIREAYSFLDRSSGSITDIQDTGTICHECGAEIPDSEPNMMNKFHKNSCSLHAE